MSFAKRKVGSRLEYRLCPVPEQKISRKTFAFNRYDFVVAFRQTEVCDVAHQLETQNEDNEFVGLAAHDFG